MDPLKLQLSTTMTFIYVLHALHTEAKGILLGIAFGSIQLQLCKSIN